MSCSIYFCHLGPANSPPTGDYPTMIRRHIEDSVRRAMTDTPVVLLNGAPQTGKTTLAQAISGSNRA
jgi:SpoVK/Ycf46/Vps4 family AAA+-type ATPase